MADYVLSNVTEIYEPSANPPVLDKVVITLDHISERGRYSTYDVVKFLVNKNIPVTVFMECTDSGNLCKVDKSAAEKIFNLNPDLVRLGVHPLGKTHFPSGESTTNEEQNKRLQLISNVIYEITKERPVILSYHGEGAGPQEGVIFEGIEYARGIKTWVPGMKSDPLETPVIGLVDIEQSFTSTRLRNELGLSATLFTHTNELTTQPKIKLGFDTFLKNIIDGRLLALDYYSAMKRDFSKNPKCPLAHFTSNTLTQNLFHSHRDGNGNIYQVSELQRFLNELGFEAGMVDGIYGDRTKMAVLMYQVDNELLPDGEVGDSTRSSINTFCD